MGLMDQIQQKQQQEQQRGEIGNLFGLAPNTQETIRFLMDGNDGATLYVHRKWDDFNKKFEYVKLCLSHIGKECPWCEQEANEGVDSKIEYYSWLIWNITQKRVQCFFFHRSRTTPIDDISNKFAVLGTLVQCDIVYSCTGPKNDKKYSGVNMPNSAFNPKENGIQFDTNNIQAMNKLMIKMILQANNPEVFDKTKQNGTQAKQTPKAAPAPVTVPASAPKNEEPSYDADLDGLLDS